jgi:hypothetical protein
VCCHLLDHSLPHAGLRDRYPSVCAAGGKLNRVKTAAVYSYPRRGGAGCVPGVAKQQRRGFVTAPHRTAQHSTALHAPLSEIHFNITVASTSTKVRNADKRGRDHSLDLRLHREVILKWISKKQCVGMWIGYSWHWIGSSSGSLLIRPWSFAGNFLTSWTIVGFPGRTLFHAVSYLVVSV